MGSPTEPIGMAGFPAVLFIFEAVPAVFVRPTTGAVSSRSCGFVLPLPFKCLRAGTRTKGIGATYMLPRGGRLRVCCCGQMALAALPRYAATFTWLLLSRQPRSRCWSRMLPTMKSHGPFWLPRPDPKWVDLVCRGVRS